MGLFDALAGMVGAARSADKRPVFTPEMDQQIQNPKFDWASWYAQPPQGYARDSLPSMDDVEARRLELQQLRQGAQQGQQGLRRAVM